MWFKAFELNTCRKFVTSEVLPEGSDAASVTSLVVDVQQMTNMHKKVVVRGHMMLSNHVCEDLEVKVTNMRSSLSKDEHFVTLKARSSHPSIVACASTGFAVKVRCQGQRVQWSQDLIFSNDTSSTDVTKLVTVR